MVRVGRPLVTVGLAVVALLLVAVVATGDHVPLATEGTGGWRMQPRPLRDDLPAPAESAPFEELPDSSELPGERALAVLAQTMLITVGGLALFLIGRRLWRLSRRPAEPIDLPPEEHWPATVVAPEIVDAVDDGLAALADGPIDDVVVACWVRLEEAAAAAGAGRRPSETSAELAARILDELHAPGDAVAALLHRYRRARYSHHRLDEDDRAAAIRALADIRAGIAGAHA
jgi:hypothetical protein